MENVGKNQRDPANLQTANMMTGGSQGDGLGGAVVNDGGGSSLLDDG